MPRKQEQQYAIVAGGGKVGANVTRSLIDFGHEVTLVEQRREEAADPHGFERRHVAVAPDGRTAKGGVEEVVASEAAHLSVPKAASLLGLRYRPDALSEPGDLSRAALVLTAGTTVRRGSTVARLRKAVCLTTRARGLTVVTSRA